MYLLLGFLSLSISKVSSFVAFIASIWAIANQFYITKRNVNQHYGGDWKRYFKDLFKTKKK